jgi:MFS family permease
VRTTFAALRVRNYRLFAIGSLVSNVGTWMQRIAQDWLVLALTGSAGALGITTGLQFLPILLFSPMAGVIADRFSKRSVMMVTQLSMAVTAATLGVLAITGAVTTWHVYALAFVFGTGTAVDAPARQTFVHEMIGRDRLANAVALNSALFNLARMIGPALAGGLIALLGSGIGATGWVILINGTTYLAVVLALKYMRTEELRPVPLLPRGKGQLRDGVAYVRSRPDILLVLGIVFCAGTFSFNYQMTTALMATKVFDKGAGEYGILGSIIAVGALAGALIAAHRGSSGQRLVIGAAIGFGAVTAVAGLMPSYLTFALVLPIAGMASMTLMTAANSFVQMAADPAMRGRVMALYFAVFMGGTPAGAPLLGWVADQFGARWTLVGGGATSALGTVFIAAFAARKRGLVLTRYVGQLIHREPELGPVVTD